VALLAALVSGCGGEQAPAGDAEGALQAEAEGPAQAPTPTMVALPDLVASSGEMAVQGTEGGCAGESASLVTRICARNEGAGDAGPFVVRALHRQGGGAFSWEVEGLAAGEERCFEAEGRTTGRATVDVDGDVEETDEFNNDFIVPLATAVPVCTPTLVPTTTPTPAPLAALTATPFPEDARVKTEVFPVYNCTYLGNGVFEWYRVEVTYVNGEPVQEEVIRGPYTGEWQGGCPPNPAEPEPEN
jgi:hypothetical protein